MTYEISSWPEAVGAARADPHHEELSHHRSLNESSIDTLENATVTPP